MPSSGPCPLSSAVAASRGQACRRYLQSMASSRGAQSEGQFSSRISSTQLASLICSFAATRLTAVWSFVSLRGLI